ncbi:fibronectin type III domain protein [Glaciihabitans tibetensis]|uniref:Fibronectin type III domain protein n=1 Tax=Glaciihabitans tibetensis TaxID=1266600 RepID=A0A2T0VG65_9MICO|nr:Ig-like domain-containing protein [Glaciihabitans tibetensis]PRY69195.1 fibronectin type III domain protein [Glaciihabitans tibetensis]
MSSATIIAVLAGVPITFAVLHEGFPITDVELEVQSVWVTNGPAFLAGRLNRQIEELDASVQTATDNIDVLQNGDQIFLHDRTQSTLERIDPAYTTLLERAEIPLDSEVILGGTTLSVVDPASGNLWIVDVANELNFNPTTVDPDLELGEGGHATVTADGTIFATSPDDGVLYTIDGWGNDPVETSLSVPESHQLSAVGDTAVILDDEADTVIFADGETVDLGSDGLKLQQPSLENSYALVAGATGLLQVPLDGGEVTEVVADIVPVVGPAAVTAPVWLDGCAHGAWAGEQRYLQACDGDTPNPITIEQPTVGAELVFRVNKNVIALNNVNNGNAWIVKEALRLVDNWEEVTPPEQEDTEEGDEKSAEQSFEDTLAERTDQNRPPVARDDEFGVRPNRTTILPVLDNDTDPDGDVLVITKFTALDESVGKLDAIDGGRALQFTPAASTVGGTSFRYTVSDGRPGGVAEASVNINIVPLETNRPPEQKRGATAKVESGQSIGYNVLSDWTDPDGDDIFLDGATAASGDEVRFTPDGFVTFQHRGGELGQKSVPFVVSDGALSGTGELVVEVVAAGGLSPVGTPDYAQAFAGDTVVVEPLKNDLSPSGAQLTLLGVEEVPANATVSPNLDRGTVAVSSADVGTIYLKYSLGAGANTSIGLIRVEFREDLGEPLPPVAVKDIAFLRQGEATSVEVLNNDVSPDGSVLAVQSVDISTTNAAVSVEVLNNTIVRVSASSALTEQTQFSYTISDGVRTATAGVTIVPVPPIVNRQPPVAVDDRVSVRAGDFVSVPVLANDFHPDQAQLLLTPEFADVSAAGTGLLFTSGAEVRYQAPKEAGEYRAVYRVQDQFGESATATVTFVVTPLDLDTNQPPVPTPQTARTFAGATVRIDVPLDSIDPNGDSVVLTGYTVRPEKGRIVTSASDHFIYEAYAGSAGTDTFSYEVQDTYGARAIGVITVGVIPRADTTSPPNAVDDAVEVKPGKTVSVEPLLNDSDPNGFALSLVEDLVEVDEGIVARTDGSKVIIEAPETEGAFSLRYQIGNGEGGVDYAFISVKVTKDAATLYPSAIDYYVPVDDVVDAESVAVDIRELINNPNGLDSDLLLSVEGPNASVASVDQATGRVTVAPGETRIAVAYRVTDPLDPTLTATAFIVVPPEVSASYSPPPYLRPDLDQQIIEMNGEMEWDLADILVVPSGRPAILTDTAKVSANYSDGSPLFVDNNTLRFSAATDFRGQTDIAFEVTDGSSADDLNGNTVLLTLPVTVGDPNFEDTAPTFTALDLSIEAGEEALTVNLQDSTSHQNRALLPEFRYGDLSGASAGIVASLSGSQLTVSAPRDVNPGATTTLQLTITYRDFVVPATVTVHTVPSTRPLAQATIDELKGQRTKATSLNVLANDFNPFAQDGEPLVLTDARVDNAAETSASVSFTADGTVNVVPDASFIGVVSIVYTVEDATGDATRTVQGRFLVTVRDVPSQIAPAPVIRSEGDQEVTVSWTTPATNGEPILGYTITWESGVATLPSGASQFTATGLANGSSYTFRVKTRNVLGESTISDPSAVARPFGAPGAPPSVTLTGSSNGSGSLSMSWGEANGNGRGVSRYVWTLANGTSGEVSGTTRTASTTVPVGTAHTFTVTAFGPTGLAGAPSGSSASQTPTPGAPAGATATAGAKGDRNVQLTWGAARSDGASPQYEISINGGGWTNMGGATSHTHAGEFGQATSFGVRAVANGVIGGVTTSNSASPVDVDPVAVASATIYKGGVSPDAPCCRSVGVTYQNYVPGYYAITTFINGAHAGLTESSYAMLAPSGSLIIRNSLGIRNDASIQLRLTGPGGVLWSDEITGAQWNAMG